MRNAKRTLNGNSKSASCNIKDKLQKASNRPSPDHEEVLGQEGNLGKSSKVLISQVAFDSEPLFPSSWRIMMVVMESFKIPH